MSHQPPIHLLAVACASLIAGSAAMPVAACPFCEPMAPTFSERIAAGDVALVGTLVSAPADNAAATAAKGPVAKSVFRVERVFRGEKLLEGKNEMALPYNGNAPPERSSCWWPTRKGAAVVGAGTAHLAGVEYLAASRDLPKAGPERLVFFQQYLEDPDQTLDRDAYNEFAQAPYDVILAMKDKLRHDKLIEWVRDPKVEDNRRRLYLTLLGTCGSADDVPLLENMLASRAGKSPSGLDALVACYLKLKGPDGVPLIEDRFLKNRDAEFSDTYAAITALRFIAEQTDAVPRTRVSQAFYHMLDRPDLADLVIVDLARWRTGR